MRLRNHCEIATGSSAPVCERDMRELFQRRNRVLAKRALTGRNGTKWDDKTLRLKGGFHRLRTHTLHLLTQK